MDEEEIKINELKTKHKKPPTRYRSTRDYDFLQYIRLVYNWAYRNSDLNKGELEMLLYLYPRGVFKKATFFKYQKTISIKQQLVLRSLLDRGWLVVWRPKTRDRAMLLTLSQKAKKLCDRMHKMLVGEMDMAETPDKNEIAKKKLTIDKYVMDIIKEMNSHNKKIREGDKPA